MPIKVGFAGAGGIACAHMNLLQMLDDVQIVSVSDINKSRAESVASRFFAKAYDDSRKMIESEHLDALYVCVPPFAHEELELIAASRGIHLFVEKPVAISMDTANKMSKAISDSGVVTAVGYHWRYQNCIDRAKDILAGREIGMIQGYWMGGFPEVGWWRKMEYSGGQMVDQTTHIFDLARYLCGEIVEVYAAYSNKILKDIDDLSIYDVSTATLKFKNGAVGSISSTCILDVPYTVGIHVIAKNLVMEIHGDIKIIEPGHTETYSGGSNAMLEENRVFIDAVKTGDRSKIRSDYEDAVKTLAVTLACNNSAKSGLPVKISI